MKKIIIAILLVFSCGIFALTIPKIADAEELSYYNNGDNFSANEVDSPVGTHFDVKYTTGDDDIGYSPNYTFIGPDLTISIYQVSYWYERQETEWIIAGFRFYYVWWFTDTLYNEQVYYEDYVDLEYAYIHTYISDFNSLTTQIPVYDYLELYIYYEYSQLGFSIIDGIEHADYEITFEFSLREMETDFEHGAYTYSTTDRYSFPSNTYPPMPLRQYNDFYSYSYFTPSIYVLNNLYEKGLIKYEFPSYVAEDTNFLGFIQDATTGFLETELFGTVSIADILLFIVSVALLIFLLRFFAGG